MPENDPASTPSNDRTVASPPGSAGARVRLFSEALARLTPRHRLVAVATALGMTLVAALESVSIGLIFPFISLLAGGTTPDYVVALFSSVGLDVPSASALAVTILAILLVKSAVVVGVFAAQSAFLGGVARDFGARALAAHISAPFEEHLRRSDADMTASVVGRLYTVLVFLYEPLFIVASEALVILAIVAILLAVEPGYTLMLLAAFGLIGWLGNRTVRRRAQRAGDEKEVEHRKLLQTYSQTLGAIAEIHMANREQVFRQVVGDHLDRYASAVASERFILYMPRTFVEAGVSLLMFGGLVIALNGGFSGGELLGLVALFAAAAVRLMPSASRLLHAITMINLSRDAFDRMLPDLLAGTTPSAEEPGGGPRIEFRDEIVLSGVSYRYPAMEEDALGNVSLRLRRGERIAIAGSSGSGKTTLLWLLVGLLKPRQGSITVDGRDIGSNLNRLRDIVAFVPQEPILIDGSLRDNIVFGWEGRDDGQLDRVVGMARLDPVIRALPAGLDTVVGESDVRLSRGQIQRVAIARALYRDPCILIMDEPTASLDATAENDIIDALGALDDAMTIIVVSHRESVLDRFSRRIELEDGRIASDSHSGGPDGSAG